MLGTSINSYIYSSWTPEAKAKNGVLQYTCAGSSGFGASLRETNESKAGMTDGATRHPKLIIDHQFVTTITFLTYTHGASR